MKVSLSPLMSAKNNKTNFKSLFKRDFEKNPATKQEIETAKTKKIVSELSCIAGGIALIYFAMKINIKHEKWLREVVKDLYKKASNTFVNTNPVREPNINKFL